MSKINLEAVTAAVVTFSSNLDNAARHSNPEYFPKFTDVWKRTWEGIKFRTPAEARREIPERAIAGWENFIEANQELDSSLAEGVIASLKSQLDAMIQGASDFFQGEKKDSDFYDVISWLTSLEQMVSTAFSFLPSVSLPALRMLDQDIGLPHAHPHPPNLTPPNPVPVPLPSSGPIIPIPFISGAESTLINGIPAARCGDWGIGIWCGGYFPLYEVFVGSNSVWIQGMRAARLGLDFTSHCIFSTSVNAPKSSDKPIGPPVGFTISASPNVMIGGVPLPSAVNFLVGKAGKALFKGIGKLAKRLQGLSGKAATRFSRRAQVVSMAARESGEVTPAVRGVDRIDYRSNYLFASRKVEELERKGVIRIAGDEAFAEGVRRDLRRIACSDTGKRLISELEENHGKYGTYTEIRPLSDSPRPERGPHAESWSSSRLSDKGEPSSSTVYYEPGKQGSPTAKHSPSDAVLTHELEHSKNAGRGELADDVVYSDPDATKRWQSLEEEQAVRREDAYRRERGLPTREKYGRLP